MTINVGFIFNTSVEPPDAEAIIAAAADMGFELHAEEGKRDPLVFNFEDGHLMVMPIGAPHPDAATMARGPLSPPSDVLESTSGHTIVTAMNLQGDSLLRETTMAALCAAVIKGSDAVAAMLGDGLCAHRADVFCDLATHAVTTGAPPVELLVDVTAAREGEDRMSLLSHGMVRHGREEFFVTCPIKGQGAMGFMFDMVRWMLMDKDKTLPAGDTIGRTQEERFLVKRAPSPTGEGPEVIRLDL